MRGYVTFLLVFVSLLVITASANSYLKNANYDSSRLIALEKNYQIAMNLKEVAEETAFYGATKGIGFYLLSLPVSKKVDFDEMEKAAQLGGYAELSQLKPEIQDYEIKIWCGTPNSIELDLLKEKMVNEKKAIDCKDCVEITNPACAEFIDVEIDEIDFRVKQVKFGGQGLFLKKRTGVSVYSQKYRISSATYMREVIDYD